MNDGRLMWECSCYVRSWAMKHTAYATSKKEAKQTDQQFAEVAELKAVG